EPVGDLLGILERLRDDEVHSDRWHRRRAWHRGDLGASLTASRPGHGRPLIGVGIGPVVELLASAAWRQPPDVRALAVRAPHLLLGDVTVLVPFVVLFGDSEVDERAVPYGSQGPFQRDSNRGRERSRSGSGSRPPRRRFGSPGSCPSADPSGLA